MNDLDFTERCSSRDLTKQRRKFVAYAVERNRSKLHWSMKQTSFRIAFIRWESDNALLEKACPGRPPTMWWCKFGRSRFILTTHLTRSQVQVCMSKISLEHSGVTHVPCSRELIRCRYPKRSWNSNSEQVQTSHGLLNAHPHPQSTRNAVIRSPATPNCKRLDDVNDRRHCSVALITVLHSALQASGSDVCSGLRSKS